MVWRYMLIGLFLASLLGNQSCMEKKDVYSSLHLAFTSDVSVDEIRLTFIFEENGTQTVVSSETHPFSGLEFSDLAGFNLTEKAYVAKVDSPGRVNLLLFAQGLSQEVTVALFSGSVSTEEKRSFPVHLEQLDLGCDGDADGFPNCSKAGCCTDYPEEFADCDDAEGLAFPVQTKIPTCIPCSNTPDYLCDGNPPSCVDEDGDGGADCDILEDCDSGSALVAVGLPELCDGLDNDCDGEIDEDFTFAPCAGDELNGCSVSANTVCSEDGLGVVCESSPATKGTACDDGDTCTMNDSCDGVTTECAGVLYECQDGVSCTVDLCDGSGGCSFDLEPSSCFIEGECFAENELKLDTTCQICSPAVNQALWSLDVGYCLLGTQCIEEGDVQGCTQCASDENGGKLVFLEKGTACDSEAPCAGPGVCSAGGECEAPQLGNGSPCDDELFCSKYSVCLSGICVPDDNDGCEDGNECTLDLCDEETETCTEELMNDGVDCQDNDLCTQNESCLNGLCQGGTGVVCDDGNLCTLDSCTSDLGCLFSNENTACNDGDPCTLADLCSAGECQGGTLLDCDDGNECTEDVCLTESGCTSLPSGDIPCDEVNLCTKGSCDGEVCGTLPVPCDDGNECTLDSCDAVLGCLYDSSISGDCDDGDLCTTGETCSDGFCGGGFPADCDDGNECTTDMCGGVGGCSHTHQVGSCNEGNLCTTGVCVAGECSISSVSCDDGNTCTDGSCAPAEGCSYINLTGTVCDDANACTENETCVEGACDLGGIVNCNDGDVCTDQTCNSTQGCLYTSNSSPCNDGSKCTEGFCVEGTCSLEALKCDDENPCTDDLCVFGQGCVFLPNSSSCEDGNVCTLDDGCQGGLCIAGSLDTCDDSNVCTSDACNEVVGCVNLAQENECDTEDKCTVGVCEESECATTPSQCDDGDVCTLDGCSSLSGCTFEAITGESCSDDNACTEDDVCVSGVCIGGKQTLCDDGEECTADACDDNQGCLVIPLVGAACTDDLVCTTGNVCETTGLCGPGDEVQCDDGNVCTIDTCSPSAGCEFSPANFFVCDDGNDCTAGDVCQGGECTPGSVSVCECLLDEDCPTDDNLCDGITFCDVGGSIGPPNTCQQSTDVVVCESALDTECKENLCDPTLGVCLFVAVSEGLVCSDGNDCTENETCFGGTCTGIPVTCTDDNACTDDICFPASGCEFTNNTLNCDDGNACTEDDLCDEGLCVSGTALECEANANSCTFEYCDQLVGCTSANLSLSCDDEDACTVGDTCSLGDCVGSAQDCNDGDACTVNSCDPSVGCLQSPSLCDDGLLCTDDSCDSATGCVSSPVFCDDGDTCTADACDAVEGCQSVGISCDDDDACTEDTCATFTGCAFTEVVCDDGDACTVSSCESDSGCVSSGIVCADSSLCTADSCDSALGCVFEEKNCDDADLCTVDSCDEFGECVNALDACSDGISCTADSCDTFGCVHTPENIGCGDGNFCTEDICETETGCSYANIDCSDGNDCTEDSCDSSSGCINTGLICEDGIDCTVNTCLDGICGFAADDTLCDDKNPCTVNSCDLTLGCGAVPLNCDDGIDCTSDLCVAGVGCDSTPVDASCEDGLNCTQDFCDLIAGCGASPIACDDGQACTDDSCDEPSGLCVFIENAANCEDGTLCTLWSCGAESGCIPSPETCDDADVCTTDLCDNGDGNCSNTSISCDDEDPCTTDSCDINTGCVHDQIADQDGDGVCDFLDENDSFAGACMDSDGDGCDDCVTGSFDPADDGLDLDGDGLCTPCPNGVVCPDGGFVCLPTTELTHVCQCWAPSLGCDCPLADVSSPPELCEEAEVCLSDLGCLLIP